MNAIPQSVAELVDMLAALPGAVAVVLGGSRAVRLESEGADWDLGVYYRGEIELAALAKRGTVFPPGSWGRVMNGGAWLECVGEKVDVILRDLDVVEYWSKRAEEGEFERDALLGYLAGIPTYTLTAELASCRPLRAKCSHGRFHPGLPKRRLRCGVFADPSVSTMRERMQGGAMLPAPQVRRLPRLWKRLMPSCVSVVNGCATRNV